MTRAERAARDRAEHRRMVRRILAAWRGASAADLAAGLEWYDVAYATAAGMAAGTRGAVTVEQAAGVIAALSPRAQWVTNVGWAARMIDAHVSGAPTPSVSTRRNRGTACAILDGRQAGPTGRKVAAFYAAILGDRSAVVVDVWAARAAGLAMPDGRALSPRQYDRIADAYRAAAERLDVAPRDLQAAVWVAARGRAS